MSTHGLDHCTAAPPRRLFRLPSSTRTSPVTFELYQNDGEREHRIRYSECSEEDEDEDEDVEEYEDYLSPTVLSNYAAPPHPGIHNTIVGGPASQRVGHVSIAGSLLAVAAVVWPPPSSPSLLGSSHTAAVSPSWEWDWPISPCLHSARLPRVRSWRRR